MQAHPLTGKALQAVRHSNAGIVAFEGAVRSAKTFTSTIAWMDYVRNGPPGPLLMAGRTERTVKQNLIDPMIEMVGEKRCRFLAGSGVLHLFGRRIYIVGANDERAVTKIQGLTLAGAYVDECATIPETFFNMLYSRLSIAGARLWLTSNPASPAHWLKTKWLDRARLWIDREGTAHRTADGIDLHRFTFVLEDNPHLPAEYVARVKAGFTGLFYRRYILAEWVAAEGAIFDMWNPDRHVLPWTELPAMERLLALGVDYGTTNASTGLLLGVGADHRLYLADEWRQDPQHAQARLTDGQLSASLRSWLTDTAHAPRPGPESPEWLVVDPAAASFRLQLYRDGLTPQPADNDVLRGISLLATLLADDRLKVSDRCAGFIREAPGYSWDPAATLRGEDKPLKVADHSLDGGRYAVATTEALWRPYVPTALEVAA